MELNKIVKKLQKKNGAIVTIEDIGDILDPGSKWLVRDKARIHQVIYALKWLGTLISIRNGLYYVADGILHSWQEVVEARYWDIVKMIAHAEALKDWVIGGEKALELIMMDYSIPYQLIIYTKDIAKKVVVSPNHEIVFRTIISWEKQHRSNAYGILKKQSQSVDILKVSFPVLWLESALLDALTIHDHEEGIAEPLVLKFLKRYESRLERWSLGILVSVRYIRAINRLREITKNHAYDRLYEICLDVIKKEGWGCFVTF